MVPADEASLALSWAPAPLVVWADPVDLVSVESETADPAAPESAETAGTEVARAA